MMFSAEENYFLQLISDYIYCKDSACNSEIDWNKIFELSRIHNLNGVIFNQSNKFMSDDIKEIMFTFSAKELSSYTKRKVIYKSICDKFNNDNIKFFTVKGFNVSKYYQYPQHRTMGDCDIQVSDKNVSKADTALKELGFELHKTPMFENVYQKFGLSFEIHNHLLYDEIGNKKEEIAFCDKVWDYVSFDGASFEGKIDESFHFVYLLLHLKKHLIHSGAGFRQFLDIYLTAKNANLDWNYINNRLNKLNLSKFSQVCGALTYKWFGEGNPSPFGFELAQIDNEFYVSVTKKIFSNGVFGFNDSSNKSNNAMHNEIIKENFTVWQKLVSKIHIVFPRYNDIRFAKKYSFVDNKPLLLPVAWVYRFFCVLFGKAGNQSNKNTQINNSSFDERKDMLEKLGLL